MKKLLIFDYDKTLARPVCVPSEEMLNEVARLLKENYLAVMSGGRTKEQIVELFVKNIPVEHPSLLENILICPQYGTLIYQWRDESLKLIYEAEEMVQEDKDYIYEALETIQWEMYGIESVKEEQILDKGAYISIDCFGKEASKDVREAWDPDKIKRQPAKNRLDEIFKGKFDVFASGRTTIDILAKGNNKADNTQRLAKMLDIPLKNVVFTGDEFQVYGNDYPLLSLEDIKINIIQNPQEALTAVRQI